MFDNPDAVDNILGTYLPASGNWLLVTQTLCMMMFVPSNACQRNTPNVTAKQPSQWQKIVLAEFQTIPGGSAILKQVQPIPAMPWRLFLFLPAAIGQTPGPGPYDLVAVQLLEEAGVSTATPS